MGSRFNHSVNEGPGCNVSKRYPRPSVTVKITKMGVGTRQCHSQNNTEKTMEGIREVRLTPTERYGKMESEQLVRGKLYAHSSEYFSLSNPLISSSQQQ